jgi:hypothetical protein
MVPTCDRRCFAVRAIHYFLEQGYLNRKLVIVDDSADCVADMVSADSLIRCGRIPGRRATAAKRNVVREHPHGELVVDRNDDWSAS